MAVEVCWSRFAVQNLPQLLAQSEGFKARMWTKWSAQRHRARQGIPRSQDSQNFLSIPWNFNSEHKWTERIIPSVQADWATDHFQ